MSYDFHDFELILPIIGPIPDLMIPEGSSGHKVSTAPFKIITITSVMLVVKKQVCRTELTKDQHLAMYTVSNHATGKTDSVAAPLMAHETEELMKKRHTQVLRYNYIKF